MKRHFTEEEVRNIWYNDNYANLTLGESRRWVQNVSLITKVEGKFYEVYFDRGLTENQEDEFYDQDAPEVKLVKETIVVRNWKVVE